MRVTLRCLLSMMVAMESSLDEIVNRLHKDPTYNWRALDSVRKQQQEARKTLAAVLDQMVDTGYGD